jgi:hypothetical protein
VKGQKYPDLVLEYGQFVKIKETNVQLGIYRGLVQLK